MALDGHACDAKESERLFTRQLWSREMAAVFRLTAASPIDLQNENYSPPRLSSEVNFTVDDITMAEGTPFSLEPDAALTNSQPTLFINSV